MSLLYECINTVIAVLISISSGMPNHAASIQLCVQKLRILIEDSDQNCKYVLQITFFLFFCVDHSHIMFVLLICCLFYLLFLDQRHIEEKILSFSQSLLKFQLDVIS